MHYLTSLDLAIAALLVLANAGLSVLMQLGVGKQLLIAALRTTVQLSALGMVLKIVFAVERPVIVFAMALFMLFMAGYEVMKRQNRRLTGLWGFAVGTSSMCLSSFLITLFALVVVIRNTPWYLPQYAIPLLGMILGNTMNGIAIGLDRLTQSMWERKPVIEARLMQGATWQEAISQIRRDSIRSGMIPIINSMSVAGIVSLPGLMTGQILAGSAPVEAVKYQILLMFLIAGGAGFGSILAVNLAARRLFDHRHRLRLDRLTTRK